MREFVEVTVSLRLRVTNKTIRLRCTFRRSLWRRPVTSMYVAAVSLAPHSPPSQWTRARSRIHLLDGLKRRAKQVYAAVGCADLQVACTGNHVRLIVFMIALTMLSMYHYILICYFCLIKWVLRLDLELPRRQCQLWRHTVQFICYLSGMSFISQHYHISLLYPNSHFSSLSKNLREKWYH